MHILLTFSWTVDQW